MSSFPVLYGAGLLTSVSPCVWGLLPLTMSYISTAAGEREDKQATLPTMVFASGLAAVFCTLGVVAASFGGVFGAQSQQPDAVSSLLVPLLSSGVCLAMGLQLLEFVQLPLPSLELDVLQEDSSGSSGQVDGDISSVIEFDEEGNMLPPKPKGSLFRTFLLSGSSALVASPCATPVLTSILAFVSSSHDPILGAFLLFGYTLGYSTPLMLVAATGGQALANLDGGKDGLYGKIAPWVTPLTGGILMWYGTNGVLTAVFGDPSMAALAPVLY